MHAVKVTLVDIHGSLAAAACLKGWSNIETRAWTDVKDVPQSPGTVFVSPANSIGFMDGGIDYVLSRIMFPGIEERVKAAFALKGKTTLLGRPYCPIGEAVSVPTQVKGVSLIAAPTMWLPQDVHLTHNAYHAMYAILRETVSIGAKEVIVPGLCTGCGMMKPHTAIEQMMQAHSDILNGVHPRYTNEEIIKEQPCWYENTEFKTIQ